MYSLRLSPLAAAQLISQKYLWKILWCRSLWVEQEKKQNPLLLSILQRRSYVRTIRLKTRFGIESRGLGRRVQFLGWTVVIHASNEVILAMLSMGPLVCHVSVNFIFGIKMKFPLSSREPNPGESTFITIFEKMVLMNLFLLYNIPKWCWELYQMWLERHLSMLFHII